MKTIRVALGPRTYEIRVGTECSAGRVLSGRPGLLALQVSDRNVDGIHGDRCEQALRAAGLEPIRCVVPAGESSKDLKWVAWLYEQAATHGLDRSCVMVALGGGMVGDLTGYAAATYLRGIPFIQVPTSLLAMVDSSVGGKTGVNLAQGKNLVGAFHQPIEVVADLTMLRSLPDREYVSGLAEVLKYGVIRDAMLFDRLERNAPALMAREESLLEDVIARCCEIKAEVVAADEREMGLRAILNFGHTLGHAVEKVSGYGEWLHGEAVAVGMVYAAELSTMFRGFPPAEAARMRRVLESFNLPIRLPVAGLDSWAALRQAMSTDKKSQRGSPRFVLVDRLGSSETGCEIDEASLRDAFAKIQAG